MELKEEIVKMSQMDLDHILSDFVDMLNDMKDDGNFRPYHELFMESVKSELKMLGYDNKELEDISDIHIKYYEIVEVVDTSEKVIGLRFKKGV